MRATRLVVAGPVDPVEPELPDRANGLLTASDQVLPVLPLLVALAWELAEPELPDALCGATLTVDEPPLPPSADATATLDPPMATTLTAGATTMLMARPPGPATGMATPPEPPLPPTLPTNTTFWLPPVKPDDDNALAPAPELAKLLALPMAVAGPVLPELPEFPEVALPPIAIAVPRIPSFRAVTLTVAAPVDPVEPELPETAVGFETALDEAFPVFPLLVALDWAEADPELPVVADGLTETLELPPLPPLALPTATLDPPTAVDETAGAATTFTAGPPDPDTGAATPPLPPLPPTDTTATWLVALPVVPELATDVAPAPLFAELVALPIAVAAPVLPELPELPDVACALAADAPKRSRNRAASAPPNEATPSRTMMRNLAVLMFLTSLRIRAAPDNGPVRELRTARPRDKSLAR
ncbi:MAG: hypothetical protein ACRD12_19040 [Acidimicrobiales bacterium]